MVRVEPRSALLWQAMTVTAEGEWSAARWQAVGNRLLVGVVLAIEVPMDIGAELTRVDAVADPGEQRTLFALRWSLARNDQAVRARLALLRELAVLCRGDRHTAGDPRLLGLLPVVERALAVWPEPPVEEPWADPIVGPVADLTASALEATSNHSPRTMLERLLLDEVRSVVEDVGAHAQSVVQHTMDPVIDARYRRLRDRCERLAERLVRAAGR